jgi:hypothetical protein
VAGPWLNFFLGCQNHDRHEQKDSSRESHENIDHEYLHTSNQLCLMHLVNDVAAEWRIDEQRLHHPRVVQRLSINVSFYRSNDQMSDDCVEASQEQRGANTDRLVSLWKEKREEEGEKDDVCVNPKEDLW